MGYEDTDWGMSGFKRAAANSKPETGGGKEGTPLAASESSRRESMAFSTVRGGGEERKRERARREVKL